jgi:hypothetical protein
MTTSNSNPVVQASLLSTDLATLITKDDTLRSMLTPIADNGSLPVLQGDFNGALETQFSGAIEKELATLGEGGSCVKQDMSIMPMAVAIGIRMATKASDTSRLTSEALANLIAVSGGPVPSELASKTGAWFADFCIAYYSQLSADDFAVMINDDLKDTTIITANTVGRESTKRKVKSNARSMFERTVAQYCENALHRNLVEVDGAWLVAPSELIHLAEESIEEDRKASAAKVVADKDAKAKLATEDKVATAFKSLIDSADLLKELPADTVGVGFREMLVAMSTCLRETARINTNVAQLIAESGIDH